MTGAGRIEVIETARLTLCRQRPEDARALARLMADWDLVRMTATWPHPVTEDFARHRIEERMGAPGFYALAWHSAELIGMAHVAERAIGYLIAKPHWGRGYATELATALVEHGFQSRNEPFLEAKVWEDNPASSRVLLKLGFTEVGRHTAMNRARGQELSGIDYRLERP
ncbi:GNAT family N-acetyltransferase [Maritimibacter sp. DP1N21-5]|uniref:GNAT family N-acetyltransferase n=1 Tax=Maritimibacter sp. DP1N21-5 TaxID=2836867 RepID=UPI001C46BBA8|nr:GNAT family N-acetyltransferase [Maritimibacter sp. DP1N21-5]